MNFSLLGQCDWIVCSYAHKKRWRNYYEIHYTSIRYHETATIATISVVFYLSMSKMFRSNRAWKSYQFGYVSQLSRRNYRTSTTDEFDFRVSFLKVCKENNFLKKWILCFSVGFVINVAKRNQLQLLMSCDFYWKLKLKSAKPMGCI